MSAVLELWWVWVAAGFGLAALEVVISGFVFVGFAIGAVLMGGLVALGLFAGSGIGAMFAVFALLSLIAWSTLRRLLGLREGQVKYWRRDIND